ncbi:MAG: disulfide oxidoreductase [Rhodospirillaceae bacterium]|nr:disulfide oxidoreductase [Rhodospirillaceae bacterium]
MTTFNTFSTTAVLGPTNTGKTHLALERMLGYQSGMIGFPLRLLARENYERVIAKKGKNSAALVTGEEKIIPPQAKYFLCTVEAMPADRLVEFLAIDEIQLSSDPDRGHVFTDRLLNARGTLETMFLGASTIEPLLRKIMPEIQFITRPRLSKLTYTGLKKITRLPKKSAIIAFSAQDVYSIAELIRNQRGGAAVVLGALSPRTRNSQVALYQNNDVDYLIATDAIGMGLNMSINHVAFAENVKFDGRVPRKLSPQELAQIAGRAGRYMNDGTFGVTADCPEFEDETVLSIEEHSFESARSIFWRNADLSYDSISDLTNALDLSPPYPFMKKKWNADDHRYFLSLSRVPAVREKCKTRSGVRLLWEVCQIPDFSRTLSESHVMFLAKVFSYLTQNDGILPSDWVTQQMRRFDRLDGDIDTLLARISHVRTWTYISHKSYWTLDPMRWQQEARAIEDRLSDTLHEKLTQRFVDKRAAVLVQKMRDNVGLLAGISAKGEVTVEGHRMGKLDGLLFLPDTDGGPNEKTVLAAARRILPSELTRRVEKIRVESNEYFRMDDRGSIYWRDSLLAFLKAGRTPLNPNIAIRASDQLKPEQTRFIELRLKNWIASYFDKNISPLTKVSYGGLTGPARGILFQITEALGTIPRKKVNNLAKKMSVNDRRVLAAAGVRFGTLALYFPELLKPRATELLSILWCIYNKPSFAIELPKPGQVTIAVQRDIEDGFYNAIGFVRLGKKAIRADIVERSAAIIRKLAQEQLFAVDQSLLSLLGVGSSDISPILSDLGYKKIKMVDGKSLYKRKFVARGSRKVKQKSNENSKRKAGTSETTLVSLSRFPHGNDVSKSPFSVLKNLRTVNSK